MKRILAPVLADALAVAMTFGRAQAQQKKDLLVRL
jgi:hypothetical protein